jgi:hypothetical protein
MNLRKSLLVVFAGVTFSFGLADAAILASWDNITAASTSEATENSVYTEGAPLVSSSSASLSSGIASISDLVTVGTGVQYSLGFPNASMSDTALNLKNLNTSGNYISFTLTAEAGFTIDSLDSLILNMYRNGANAPATYIWEYQVNGGSWNAFSTVGGEGAINKGTAGYGSVTFTPGASLSNLNATTVSFRLHTETGYEGLGNGNTHINQITLNGATMLIPEPSTYALGVVGIFGALALIRRRRK